MNSFTLQVYLGTGRSLLALALRRVLKFNCTLDLCGIIHVGTNCIYFKEQPSVHLEGSSFECHISNFNFTMKKPTDINFSMISQFRNPLQPPSIDQALAFYLRQISLKSGMVGFFSEPLKESGQMRCFDIFVQTKEGDEMRCYNIRASENFCLD